MSRKFFDRMSTSWFAPPPEAVPSRGVRMTTHIPDAIKPTVDEFTARAALEMLENHAFVTIMERMKKEAVNEFTTSLMGESGAHEREAAHLKLRVLDDIETSVRSMADELKLHQRHETPETVTNNLSWEP